MVLARVEPNLALKAVLQASNGVKVVVDKQREIWFDENVKLHLDEVVGLGTFVEIEAVGSNDADLGLGELKELTDSLDKQCRHFLQLFGILEVDLIDRSYSDLLLELSFV